MEFGREAPQMEGFGCLGSWQSLRWKNDPARRKTVRNDTQLESCLDKRKLVVVTS